MPAVHSRVARREATRDERIIMHTLRYMAKWEYQQIGEYYIQFLAIGVLIVIGYALGFHPTTVSRICGQPYTPTKRRGQPLLLRTPERARLAYYATLDGEHRRRTYVDIADKYRIAGCADTLRKAMEKEGFNRRVARKKPFLDARKKALRLQWALAHAHWTVDDWRHVIWTDESYIWLSGMSGRIWVTRRPDEEFHEDCLVPKFPKQDSIMIWGAICGTFGGTKCPLILWDREGWGTINSTSYINHILLPALLPFWYVQSSMSNRPAPLWVMEDGAPAHTAKQTGWFRRWYKIPSLPWPPSSPDLNPIEAIWGRIKKRLNMRMPRPRGSQQLIAAVLEEWNLITQEEIMDLIDSMPMRVQAVIIANGGHTQY